MTFGRDDLLNAFRDKQGPSAAAVDRIEQRLRTLGQAPEPAAVVELPRPLHRDRRVQIGIAVAALAAALVLGWWIRGVALTPAEATNPNLAEDQAVAEPELKSAVEIRPETSTRGEVPNPPPPSPEPPSLAPTPPLPPAKTPPRPSSRAGKAPAPADEPPPPEPPPPEPPPPEPPPPDEDSLAEEVSLLRKARAELSAGRARGALQILTAHRQRFPRGILGEEAAAVRAVAKCRLTPKDRPSLGAKFLKRYPKSLFRAQVESACKNEPE